MTVAVKKLYATKTLIFLLGITQQAVSKRARKEGWTYVERKVRGGGREYIFSSMPEATQLEIRAAEARLAAKQESALVVASPSVPAVPKNKAALDKKRRAKALAKADLVSQYMQWQRRFDSSVAQKEAFISAYLSGVWPELKSVFGEKVSWKSLERWKLQLKEDGVTALADKRGYTRKGQTILTEQHKIIVLGQFLNPNAPNIGECIPRIEARFQHEGLAIPSSATIRRFLNRYMTTCFDEYTLWREGKKAWNDKCAMSILRDWSVLEVGDVVIADGHTLNFETLNPATGKPSRMTIVLFYDGRSNCPLGWDVMATENTAVISSAFRRTCMVLGKIPRVVYLDNGQAFRAKYFKGTADFGQAGIQGLYQELGCEVIHAWSYHGQSKTVERFFGTMHEMEVAIPSYTGNSIARKPPRMMRGEKLHRELYDKMGGRPLTMVETVVAIDNWFKEYASRPQYRTHLQGKSPAEVLEAGRGPGIDVSKLNELMLQKEIATVTKDGIRHQGRLYYHEKFRSIRHKVLIRYDNLAPYSVLVYDMNNKPICEAFDRYHHRIAAGLHPVARALGSEEEQQALSEAIAMKNAQWERASADMKYMMVNIVLPETIQRQKELEASQQLAIEEAKPALTLGPQKEAKPEPTLTSEEIAEVEAAKAQARAEKEARAKAAYTPSFLKQFKDELARYDYLFVVKYEKGIELVEKDEDWMQTYEETESFIRNFKDHYDARLELKRFREQRKVS